MKRNKHFKWQRLIVLCLSLFIVSVSGVFAQITVTGQVTSSTDNQPLPGVNVTLKGTTVGTITDLDGKYTIQANSEDDIIVFSMVGMLTEEVRVGNQTEINLTMVEDLVGLDEIVVVGYGTMKKSDVSGSIVSVGEKEMTEVKTANVLESLQGKMAGVDITMDGGRTGSGVDVLIRGNKTLVASKSPLYIVDGVPYSGSLTIDQNDVESLEVLKDASSTAIYGSRGANGVVLITTKKGKKGMSKVYFDTYFGATTPYQKIPLFDRDGYITAKTDANRDTSDNFAHWNEDPPIENVFPGDELAGYENGTETDWQDVATRNGFRQNYHLGVMGGNEKVNYNTSLSYYKEKGITLSDDYKRYTYTLNLDAKLNDYFQAGGSIILSYRQRDGRGVRFTDVARMSPIVEAFDSTGKYIYQPNFANPRKNPLAFTDDKEQEIATRVFSTVYGQVNLTPDLYIKSNLGVDVQNERLGWIYPQKAPNEALTEAGVEMDNDYHVTWTNLLNYSKEFGSNTLYVTLGQELLINKQEYYLLWGQSQPFTRNLWWNMGSVDQSNNVSSSNLTETQLSSFFGRATFNFRDLIILNATGRRDGASQLLEGSKWDFFPSFSGAWRVTNMDFMQGIDIVSDLKLRAGYGVTGNSSVNAYATKSTVNLYPIRYQFGDPGEESNLDGYRPELLASESLTWEITKQTNLGIDFGLLSNRVSGSIEFYNSITDGIIIQQRLPISTGFFSVYTNAGKLETKGYELMLHSVNVNSGGFKWDMNVTYTSWKEKILELASGQQQDIANGWFVGEPVDVIYDWKKIGIWQLDEASEARANDAAPGDIKVQDIDNNDTINADDRVVVGSENPKFIASMVNTFTYKGFDLTVNIYARIGQMIDADAYDYDPRMYDNILTIDYWTPNNPTNDYPRLRADQAEIDYETTLSYRDGSYIKMKNLTVGYTFPVNIAESIKMSKLRAYFTINNPLIMYSKLDKGIDPERDGSISWPLARTYLFGLNVEF